MILYSQHEGGRTKRLDTKLRWNTVLSIAHKRQKPAEELFEHPEIGYKIRSKTIEVLGVRVWSLYHVVNKRLVAIFDTDKQDFVGQRIYGSKMKTT